jgi:hypothetical protein
MMGPNTASGHGSVTYTTECQINFTMRVIKPVMNALKAQRSSLPVLGPKADIVQVKPEAEKTDIDTVQEKVKRLVWSSGCSSWALDSQGRNTTMYPDFQYKYWLRSIFIPWGDFELSKSTPFSVLSTSNSSWVRSWVVTAVGVAVVAGLSYKA